MLLLFAVLPLRGLSAEEPGGAASDEDKLPPNLVVIVSDDQGYRDLGCAGSPEIRTPHLDALAAGGVRLTQFYVAWPACTPSRAGWLTGRYPQRNGTYDMFRNDLVDVGHVYSPEEYAVSPEMILGTDPRERFISEFLDEVGYVCGVFGKWDGGQLRRFLPLQRGFHDFYGFANTGIDYFTHERYGVPSMRRGNELTEEDRGTYCTDLFNREALRFLDEHHERPFFLYLPHFAPHSASNLDPATRGRAQAPQKYLDLYPEGETVREQRRHGLLAAVTAMDEAIGEVLEALDRYGVADNTIVVFFSDNGGGAGADNSPLRGGKAQMFEGGLRVPFMIRWPGVLPAGQTNDEFLTALELFPTLAKIAGLDIPEDLELDGFDMLPVLKVEKPSPRRTMFWQRRGDRAARVGDWKWVDSVRGSGLFHLADDIGEQHDLSETHPERLEELRGQFAAWTEAMQAAEPRGPFRDY